MAWGCAVILPEEGGVHEYAVHRNNSIVVDSKDMEKCVEELLQLITNVDLRTALQFNAMARASEYSIRRAALSELTTLMSELSKRVPR